MARNNNGSSGLVKALLIILILTMIAATGLVIFLCINLTTVDEAPAASAATVPVLTLPVDTTPTEEPTVPTVPTTLPPREEVVATASIGSTGDVLMHKPIIDVNRQADGTYEFSRIFQYLAPYASQLDFAVANLETTLAGSAKPYQGNPNFNCPDSIVDSLRDAGFDMLLTANNHGYDTGTLGHHRTLEVVREKGLVPLGTQDTEEEKKYVVQDVGGIKIGMICYTYAKTINGRLSLNGLPLEKSDWPLVNHYEPTRLDAFYTELEEQLELMRQDGAEATMVYMHWGPQEYSLTANPAHVKMSQKMCDLGVDVVIGGHPHVVQPMDLLTSNTDPDHKTVVLYSMGNAVANQRSGTSSLFPRGYTEDGILFTVTFEKYSDGKVYLLSAEALPTWVNLHGKPGAREFNILPLDIETQDQWQELYELDDNTLMNVEKSYDRTMKLVGEGLQKCQEYLAQAKADREQYYTDLVHSPAA